MEKKLAEGSLENKIMSQYTFLKNIINNVFEKKSALAAWKLPGKAEQNVIVDFSGELKKVKATLENLEKGFIFSPFINPNNEENLFLRADLHLQLEKYSYHILPSGTSGFNNNDEVLNDLLRENGRTELKWYVSENYSQKFTEKEHFESIVADAIKEIEKGTFQKVVISRNKSVSLNGELDLAKTFCKLCESYPDSFISLVAIPTVGTWIGVSPEILISVNKDKIFQTVALAGTQKLSNENIKSVSWTQKEIEEQALVERYIISCFKKIRLREYDEVGPKTVKAGNLLHLKSEFKVDMAATGFPELGSIMLGLLHPTSAVCGMPKESSLDFILRHENFNRDFYSGFLGPINIDHETHLFVNLRCMQLIDKGAVLYAGAGITEDSVPEKEWEETELKCNTILNVVGEE